MSRIAPTHDGRCKPAHNRLDLVGQRFHRLTVAQFVGVSRHHESLWECQCDCGSVTTVSGNSLTGGNTRSCGCLQKDRVRERCGKPTTEVLVKRVMLHYTCHARTKGHPFELSNEQVQQLIFADCFYCGSSPGNIMQLSRHGPTPYQGIDRLDNSKGYVLGNVVPCCIRCNKMKKVLGAEEFLDHVRRIAERHSDKLCFTHPLSRVLEPAGSGALDRVD